MPDSIREFFSTAFFMPHGHCYLWKPGLVWMQVISNGLIGLAYLAISSSLAYLVYKLREQIPFRMMYIAFGAFIVLCGVTHFFDVYVIWKPAYWIDGSVRVVTAFVSAATAVLLPPLIPHASVLARGAHAVRARGIELETAVRDLEVMYQKTKELDELKSQFFANVSHELRTPLALIVGPLERHLAAGPLTTEQRRDFEIALRNARTLHRHVDDLLDAARLEAGKLKLDYANVDLAHLVRLTASNFDGIAGERGITYLVETPPSAPAQVDRNKMERVLLNLLGNAFKFTPSNGRIRCSLSSSEGGSWVLSVRDSGPGVPSEQRDAIFERFRQLDGGATRRVGGTGLGLAIAKDFVELHRGRVSVGTAPEGGASFTVEIPRSAPAGVEVQSEGPPASAHAELARRALDDLRRRVEAVPSVQAKGKPLVLVVEDHPDMNRFVCETLAAECRTEAAFDGRTGLQKAIELSPDLILTDIMMPAMSGDELVHAVRDRAELRTVPIVLLTAKADDELRLQLLREGAQDYVTKPFSVEELRARVGNLITLKRAQDVLRDAKAATDAANRELEAFSYSVSHDLRAPLRSIDGFSQALLEDHCAHLDDRGQDYLRRLSAAAQRMGVLIDDLLQLSRVGRAEIRREHVDVSSLAQSIVAELGSDARRIDIGIQDGLEADADANLLKIVLDNLLGNACKFTKHVERPHIELAAVDDGHERVFRVRDNGAGFDMKYVGQLFAPFQRLHTEKEFPGTGIGLATVRRIITRHGGRVWAEGAVGQGATFFFTLPPNGSGAA